MLFCPLPWVSTMLRNNGDVRVCCQANQGPDKGLLRKENGDVYNAAFDDLEESKNCQKIKDIRKAMLNDQWHPDCIRCEREENSGIRSRFTYEKEIWNWYIDADKAKAMTKPDGSIDTKECPSVFYDLRFGNKCNLKCRICGPTDSDFWYSDFVKVWDQKVFGDTHGKMKILNENGKYFLENDIYKWYHNEHFWDYMETQIPYIRYLHIVGGEPLLIEQQYRFLEKCVELGYSKNIAIEHNSNIVSIPNKCWELWKNFRGIKIGASVDGIEKINDYIRYPCKWSTVVKNLHMLDQAEGNFYVWLAITVEALNIFYLPEIFEWKISQDFKRIGNDWQPIASLHPLHSPEHLNCKILPLEVKKAIKDKFDNFKFTKHHEAAKKLLDQYCNFMFQADMSHHLPDFFKFNNKLDEIRGQRMQDHLPEFYELIHKYDRGFHENT